MPKQFNGPLYISRTYKSRIIVGNVVPPAGGTPTIISNTVITKSPRRKQAQPARSTQAKWSCTSCGLLNTQESSVSPRQDGRPYCSDCWRKTNDVKQLSTKAAAMTDSFAQAVSDAVEGLLASGHAEAVYKDGVLIGIK